MTATTTLTTSTTTLTNVNNDVNNVNNVNDDDDDDVNDDDNDDEAKLLSRIILMIRFASASIILAASTAKPAPSAPSARSHPKVKMTTEQKTEANYLRRRFSAESVATPNKKKLTEIFRIQN